MTTRDRFNQWRAAAATQQVKRRWLARFWLLMGVAGVMHAVAGVGVAIERSIPALYFVSLYANYATEKSTEQGLAVELKQEAAEEAAHVEEAR